MMCVPALLAVLLVALLHANNYITCRYFHTNDESMMALICGILLFELPASVFFWMKACRISRVVQPVDGKKS